MTKYSALMSSLPFTREEKFMVSELWVILLPFIKVKITRNSQVSEIFVGLNNQR
jgi:hypothetical protein